MATKHTCEVTHAWLLAGTCPWCQVPVLRGRPVASLPAGKRTGLRWDVAALVAALDHPDPEIRRLVLFVVLRHGLPAEEALPVLRKALDNPDHGVRQEAQRVLHLRGSDLQIQEAERLEGHVLGSPDDLAARGLLLGYYFLRQSHFETDRLTRQGHILWVIANSPASALAGNPLCDLLSCMDGDAYSKAKDLWLRHVAADDAGVAILGNAANFFALDYKELSEGLLRRCQALKQGDPYWSESLGELYQRESPYAGS
jgi:hypothetical protein